MACDEHLDLRSTEKDTRATIIDLNIRTVHMY